MDFIAEEQLDVLYPDGELVPVELRIGTPQRREDRNGWGCVAQAEGLRAEGRPREMYGLSSLQSLMIACCFLYRMLLIEVEQGAILRERDRPEEFSLDTLFIFTRNRDATDW